MGQRLAFSRLRASRADSGGIESNALALLSPVHGWRIEELADGQTDGLAAIKNALHEIGRRSEPRSTRAT